MEGAVSYVYAGTTIVPLFPPPSPLGRAAHILHYVICTCVGASVGGVLCVHV